MYRLTSLLSIAALASLAQAQIGIMPKEFGTAPTYPFPVSYFAVNNGLSGLTWRNTEFHFQMLYDTSVFTGQGMTGAITINRLKFRATDGTVNAGGQVYSSVNVQMSSSPSSHAAPSTTFATNRGVDNTLVYTGSVTVLPCTGGAPNDYIIDLALTTPFTYDPSLGLDLCVEVDATAPVPATVPSFATSANAGFVDGGSRVSQNTQAATTGATSAFASVIWFEFTGPGGTSSVTVADNLRYGQGCNTGTDSFYELTTRANMDLGGGPGTENVLQAVNAGVLGYAVSTIPSVWYTPTGVQVLNNATTPGAMGDDTFSQALTLPFTFPFNGGSTTVIHACSNGYINLGATTATGGDFSPTASELLSQTARLAPMWCDLNAATNVSTNPASGIYFDVDPSGTTAYVTYVDVAQFGGTAGTTGVNVQVALHSNGDVEFRYGTVTVTGASALLIGISKGNSTGSNAGDPGSIDISASLPFTTHGSVPLDLSVQAYNFLNETRPVIGQSVTYVTSNLPASTLLVNTMINFGGVQAGLSLAGSGMPGCDLNINPFFAFNFPFAGGPASISFPVGIPHNVNLIGVSIQVQSAALVPGVNAYGALTSNGMRTKAGNY